MDCDMETPIVILASNSPRRRQLLADIFPQLQIAPPRKVDETYDNNMDPYHVAPYLSRLKAQAYEDLAVDNAIVITADTVVILDGKILGKPKDDADAKEMLRQLSGKTHQVVTGVTLKTRGHEDTFSDITDVTFGELDEVLIARYVQECRPLDKAGAYGIQEWIGSVGIKSINGSFYNVMGLPVHELYNRIKELYMGSTSK